MRAPLAAERRLAILERLVEVDAFERFLRRTYLGQKTFSIEGVDALVPITDHVIELMAAEGTAEVVLGMAHRGRLAFIAQVVGRPTESILAEFEGHMAFESGEEEHARDGRRREVPPRRRGHLHHAQRAAGDRQARRQPEPPGAGERRRRGPHPGPADLPHGRASRATTRRAPSRC